MIDRIGMAGAAAHSGKDHENGARLAIEDLNRTPVAIGSRKARFEMLSEDDGQAGKKVLLQPVK